MTFETIVLICSSAALAVIVAAKLVYRAGHRAGYSARDSVGMTAYENGYRAGWRNHAIASENLERAVAAANAANRASVIGAAERITREAAHDD